MFERMAFPGSWCCRRCCVPSIQFQLTLIFYWNCPRSIDFQMQHINFLLDCVGRFLGKFLLFNCLKWGWYVWKRYALDVSTTFLYREFSWEIINISIAGSNNECAGCRKEIKKTLYCWISLIVLNFH